MSARENLRALMQDISQRAFGEPWEERLAYRLWYVATARVAPQTFQATEEEAARLASLAAQAGGWLASPESFVPTAEWLALVEAD